MNCSRVSIPAPGSLAVVSVALAALATLGAIDARGASAAAPAGAGVQLGGFLVDSTDLREQGIGPLSCTLLPLRSPRRSDAGGTGPAWRCVPVPPLGASDFGLNALACDALPGSAQDEQLLCTGRANKLPGHALGLAADVALDAPVALHLARAPQRANPDVIAVSGSALAAQPAAIARLEEAIAGLRRCAESGAATLYLAPAGYVAVAYSTPAPHPITGGPLVPASLRYLAFLPLSPVIACDAGS